MDGQAIEIADDLLFRTGNALLSGDFVCFLECCRFPAVFETPVGVTVIRSASDLEHLFVRVRQTYVSKGVIDFARTILSAEFLTETSIGSTHVTLCLGKDGEPIGHPFPAYSILTSIDETWRGQVCIYAILNNDDLSSSLVDGLGTGPIDPLILRNALGS